MAKKERIKAVIFDLGRTLVRNKRQPHYLRLITKHKIHLDRKRFGQAVIKIFHSRVWKNIDHGVDQFAKTCGQEHNASFKHDFKRYLLHYHHFLEKYDTTDHVLQTLVQHGYKIGLISNWDQFGFDVLDYHGLRKYFHSISFSAHEGMRKPDPRLFKKMLNHLKVKPSEALMVGDHPMKDYRAAKRLGMHALLLETKEKRHKYSIRHLKQVLSYLKKINGSL